MSASGGGGGLVNPPLVLSLNTIFSRIGFEYDDKRRYGEP